MYIYTYIHICVYSEESKATSSEVSLSAPVVIVEVRPRFFPPPFIVAILPSFRHIYFPTFLPFFLPSLFPTFLPSFLKTPLSFLLPVLNTPLSFLPVTFPSFLPSFLQCERGGRCADLFRERVLPSCLPVFLLPLLLSFVPSFIASFSFLPLLLFLP